MKIKLFENFEEDKWKSILEDLLSDISDNYKISISSKRKGSYFINIINSLKFPISNINDLKEINKLSNEVIQLLIRLESQYDVTWTISDTFNFIKINFKEEYKGLFEFNDKGLFINGLEFKKELEEELRKEFNFKFELGIKESEEKCKFNIDVKFNPEEVDDYLYAGPHALDRLIINIKEITARYISIIDNNFSSSRDIEIYETEYNDWGYECEVSIRSIKGEDEFNLEIV